MGGVAPQAAGDRAAVCGRASRRPRAHDSRALQDLRAGTATARRARGGDRGLRRRTRARHARAARCRRGGGPPHHPRAADQLRVVVGRRPSRRRHGLDRSPALRRHHRGDRPDGGAAADPQHAARAARLGLPQVGGDRQRSRRRAARLDRAGTDAGRRRGAGPARALPRRRPRRLARARHRRRPAGAMAGAPRPGTGDAQDADVARHGARRLRRLEPGDRRRRAGCRHHLRHRARQPAHPRPRRAGPFQRGARRPPRLGAVRRADGEPRPLAVRPPLLAGPAPHRGDGPRRSPRRDRAGRR